MEQGALLRGWMEQGHPCTQELARIRSVELVDLPTGYWPQFTRPTELAEAILAAVGSAGPSAGEASAAEE